MHGIHFQKASNAYSKPKRQHQHYEYDALVDGKPFLRVTCLCYTKYGGNLHVFSRGCSVSAHSLFLINTFVNNLWDCFIIFSIYFKILRIVFNNFVSSKKAIRKHFPSRYQNNFTATQQNRRLPVNTTHQKQCPSSKSNRSSPSTPPTSPVSSATQTSPPPKNPPSTTHISTRATDSPPPAFGSASAVTSTLNYLPLFPPLLLLPPPQASPKEKKKKKNGKPSKAYKTAPTYATHSSKTKTHHTSINN